MDSRNKDKKENGIDVIDDPTFIEFTDADINDGKYAYTIPEGTTGTLYFSAVWQNGGMVEATTSKPFAIVVQTNKTVVVEGIDFSAEDDLKDVTGDSPNYEISLTIPKGSKEKVISLGALKFNTNEGTISKNDLKFKTIQGEGTLGSEGTKFILPAKTQTVKIEITFPDPDPNDSNSISYVDKDGVKYTAILTINATAEGTDETGGSGSETPPATKQNAVQKVPAANTAPSTENNTEQTNTNQATNNNNNAVQTPNNSNNAVQVPSDTSNQITTGTPDENGFVAVTDISFNDIAGLQPIAGGYAVTSDKSKQTILDLADSITSVNGVSVHTGVKVFPENATNKTVKWSVEKGSPIATTTPGSINMIPSGKIGVLNNTTNKLTLGTNASGTFTVSAVVKDGLGEGVDFVKRITIQVSPQNTTTNVPSTSTPSTTTPNTNTTTPVQQMPANTIQASGKQVVSVGTTEVGTSSTNSAGGGTSSKTTTYTENERKLDSTISNSDVSIEFSGECKKGISLPLRAVSKSTRQQYTDVDWEIVDDGGTNARIVNNNLLRATNTGTVTVKAIVYTSSGERMVCTEDIKVSN